MSVLRIVRSAFRTANCSYTNCATPCTHKEISTSLSVFSNKLSMKRIHTVVTTCDNQKLLRLFSTSHSCKKRYKILYDGDCTLCEKEIRVLKWMTDLNKRPVDFVDISLVEYKASDYKGVTYEMAMKEMHVIDPQGKVHSHAEAIRQMYEAVGLSLLSRVSRLPGLDRFTEKMYIRFAEYRLQKALDNCDSGKCSVKVKQLRDKMQEEKEMKKSATP